MHQWTGFFMFGGGCAPNVRTKKFQDFGGDNSIAIAGLRGGVSERTPTPESRRLRGTNHDEEPTNDSPPNPSTALHSRQPLSDQPDHQPRATDYEATPVNSRPAHQIDAGHTRLPTTSSANYFSFPNNH